MSTPLAIGAVSAVMQHIINNVALPLVPSAIGAVTSSAVAPAVIGQPEGQTRLNLFLYHVMPNPGWRNRELPSRDTAGERITNAPLALDLYYLVTAYAKNDFEAEVLLGVAMHAFHEVPVLTRKQIQAAFSIASPPAIITALKTAQIAEQVELLKITPVPLSNEELSKLWSSLLTAYRPSAVYQVSVVLIEATRPAKAPLPVLRRGSADQGVDVQASIIPPYPTIAKIELPKNRTSVVLGDEITIEGHHLGGTDVRVRFHSPHFEPPLEATILSRNDTKIQAKLPNAPLVWAAGVYGVSVVVIGTPDQQTNEVPVLVAPTLVRRPRPAPATGTEIDLTVAAIAGGRRVTVKSTQNVWPRQRVSLIIGQRPFVSDARDPVTPGTTLIFTASPASALPTGRQLIRLRVDGVDSRVIDVTVKPPQFDEEQYFTIPP